MTEKCETLDYYVRKALDFLDEHKDITIELPQSQNTLVVGSQSGLLTGRIMYRFANRSFSHAKEVLAQSEIDAKRDILDDVMIISATGSRQVVPIAQYAMEKGLRVNAVLCNKNSQLEETFKGKIKPIILPAIQEPPTVNTATYGMMIKAVTNEDISTIKTVLESLEVPEGGYEKFKSFTVLFTDRMPEVAEMVDWKLRGEKIGRCIGTLSTHLTNFMHGGAVVDAEEELYIAVGFTQEEKNVLEQVLAFVPKERKHYIDVPESFGPLGFMMLGYSVVGQIQNNYPDFQNNIWNYKERAKDWDWLSPIS